MCKTLKTIAITVLAFGIHFIFDALYFRDIRGGINGVIHQFGISHILAYIVVGIPIFAGTLFLVKRNDFFGNLGLNGNFFKALVFALACSLPMFLGFSFLFEFNEEVELNTLLVSILAAAFFEELYFRAFLFGQLYKHTALGFIASVLIGALLFGFIHLYQSTELAELAGIFLLTFLGAVLFSWAYAEWAFNLWVPIMLHLLMNLAWELFNISDNALGGTYGNVFRTTTIALVIGITILYKKRKGMPLAINRKTFFLKKSMPSSDGDLR